MGSATMQEEKSGHITEIDSFRAWAILSVLLFHYMKEFYPGAGYFLRFGWSGVDLFFVISGFVMFLQVKKKYTREDKIDFRKYLRNRFLRIVPAFYVSLIAEVLFLHRDKLFSKEFLMHLSFTHVLSYEAAFSIQPIYWTLGIEVQFYLFLILMAGILTKRRGFAFLMLLMIFCMVYRFIISSVFGFSTTGRLLINQLPGRLPQFICGILLAMAYLKTDLWQSLRKRRPLLFFAGFSILILCGLRWLHGEDAIFNDVFTETAFHPALGLSFALIMASLMGLRGTLSSVMRFRPLVFIGLISYSLYLWHFFFLEVTVNLAGLKSAVPLSIAMLITVLSALSVSTISYYLVEKQFLKLKA